MDTAPDKGGLAALIGVVVATLVGLAGPARAQEPEEAVAAERTVITLDEALELAFVNAPSMSVADQNVERAEEQALEALMARLPSLSARVTIAPAGPVRGNAIESTSGTDLGAIRDIFDTFTYQLNSELRGTLPLYTFGKIILAEDLAEIGVEVAEMRRRKAELEVIFDVTRAYLSLQLSETLDELITDGTRRLDDAEEQLEERLFEGDPTARTQLRELIIARANFAGQIADNRMLAALSRRGLEYYCGLEGDFAVEPLDDELGEEPIDELDALLAIAEASRPDLSLLNQAVIAADLAATLEWRQLTPNFFLAFGLRFNRHPLADDQPSPFADDPYNSRGIGVLVGLDWDFDFRGIARARMADEEADRARAQRDEAVGGIEIDITQAYYEAVGHQDRAVAYDEALSAARAWLRQRTLQFDSGLADFDDLQEPLLAYFGAFASYHQALYELRLARANVALKIGLERLDVGEGLQGDDSEAQTDDAE